VCKGTLKECSQRFRNRKKKLFSFTFRPLEKIFTSICLIIKTTRTARFKTPKSGIVKLRRVMTFF
jgi:hypothetical protein